MWKALSEEEKEPYTTKAKQLKADYDEVKGQTESGKKKAAKAEGPKKARSAYIIFNEYIRPQIIEEFPGIQAKEVMKLQGAKWKELSAEDKKIWEDKAKEEKEVFANSKSHLSLCLFPSCHSRSAAARQALLQNSVRVWRIGSGKEADAMLRFLHIRLASLLSIKEDSS